MANWHFERKREREREKVLRPTAGPAGMSPQNIFKDSGAKRCHVRSYESLMVG